MWQRGRLHSPLNPSLHATTGMPRSLRSTLWLWLLANDSTFQTAGEENRGSHKTQTTAVTARLSFIPLQEPTHDLSLGGGGFGSTWVSTKRVCTTESNAVLLDNLI